MNFLHPQPLLRPATKRRVLRILSVLSLCTMTLQLTGMGVVLRPVTAQEQNAESTAVGPGTELSAAATDKSAPTDSGTKDISSGCSGTATTGGDDGECPPPPELTACTLYGYDDIGVSDSQFFRTNLQTGVSTAIGSVANNADLEAIDAHPTTGVIYGFPQNGSDDSSAVLVTVNRDTGARSVIANVSSDFELPGASFNPATNELWASADTNDNLYTINLATGVPTLKLDASKSGEPQALAWNNAGTTLYVAYDNVIYTTNGTSSLTQFADVGSEVEAMEFDELGNLLVMKHGDASLYVLVGSHLVDTTKNLIGNDVETLTTLCPPPPPQPGSLKVTKIIDGSTDPDLPHSFGFHLGTSGPDLFPPLGQNFVVFDQLTPGAYTANETIPAGYHQVSTTCENVQVAAGQQATCTIHNAQNTGTLKVIKQVVGGNAQASDWKIHVKTGDSDVPGSPQDGSETGTVYALAPGVYVASETNGPAGYALSFSGDCSSDGHVTVVQGQQKTCTLTNTWIPPEPGTLTVIKHVVNDNGGTKMASDFTMQVTGTNVSDPSFAGSEQGTTVTLDAGSYSVDEVGVAGYDKSLGPNCSGTISAGQHKTCTITNNDRAPRLRLIKHVINDNGGTKQVADFPLFINGSQVTSGAWSSLNAGVVYTASETPSTGYAASTWSGDCTENGVLTLELGQDKTCEITNDDIQPQLIVHKLVTNTNGGNAVPGDFTLRVTGQNPTPSVFHGSEQGTTVALNAGSYAVTEDPYTGYTPSYSEECSGAIAAGQVKHCTVTNSDRAAHLVIVKHVVNNHGGTKHASDFTMSINGIAVDGGATFPGAEVPGVMKTVQPGTYTVTETGPDGYAASFSSGCSGTIALGETKFCTITNDDIAPRLTVTKVVVNDNGGTRQVADFSLFVDGMGVTSGVQNEFAAGTYTVHESNATGYVAVITGDCNENGLIELHPGDVKSCTITNNDLAARLTVIKHVINNNNGGIKSANDFTMLVGGLNVSPSSFPGSEQGTVVTLNAGNFSVDELNDSQYSKSFSGDCSGALSPGEEATCTVTNNDKSGFISGYKRDTEEHPLNDWTICLVATENTSRSKDASFASGDNIPQEPTCVVTGSGEWPDGYYEFQNVDAGDYQLYEVLQPHWIAISPEGGTYDSIHVQCGESVQKDFVNRQIFADLSVTKTDGLTNANPGQFITYTMVVTNNGDAAAENSTAVDTLPPQATYVSSQVDGTPATPTVTPHDAGDVLTWNLGTIGLGASTTITVVVQLDALFPFGTTVMTNNVHVSTVTAESTLENNDASDSTNVPAAPTIAIDKSGPEAVSAGDTITYTLGWSVGGNAQATNAVVSDTLPPNTSFVSATCGTTIGTCTISSATSIITWNLGTRLPGTSGTVTLTVKTATPLQNGIIITNTGMFDTAENEPVSDTVTTRVSSSPGYTVTKHDNVDPVAPGGTVVYTITWTVTGTSPLTNLVLTDTLPSQLTFVSASNSGTQNGVNPGGIVTWNLGNHAPGDTGSVTLTVTTGANLSNGVVITNPAMLKAVELDPVSTTETTTIIAAPKLVITKAVNLPFANPGDTATYTVTIANTGNDAAVNLTLTDTLPQGFTFVDGGGSTKTFSLGTLAKGATTAVTYQVKISSSQAAGFYDNTAVAKSDNHGPVSATARLEVRVPVVEAAVENPALSLNKSVSKSIVNPNETITYTINIANNGSASAVNVRLTDTLPDGFTFTDTHSAKRIWMVGTLLAGEARTIAYAVKVGGDVKEGKYRNLVIATANDQPSLKASVPVEVRVPKVLGEELPKTGAGPLELMSLLIGVAVIVAGVVGLIRSRRLPIEAEEA